jgi:hypothetical protein
LAQINAGRACTTTMVCGGPGILADCLICARAGIDELLVAHRERDWRRCVPVVCSSVVVLQGAIGRSAGASSPLVIVASTLIIAALFKPLHRRIQRLIDRRFYRSRYDAQETLTAFGEQVRSPDNASLDNLTGELVGPVQQTMQPAHVSLWLPRPPRHNVRRYTGEASTD